MDQSSQEGNWKKLVQLHRRSVLRVVSVYCKISEPANLVIAGVITVAPRIRKNQATQRKKEVGKEIASK